VETGHATRASDIDNIIALGVHASRTPVLWEHVAPDDPETRDFRWAADRCERLRAGRVEPIVTLLHHGSGPAYTSLIDPGFPLLFADYAEAAARALPWVKRWTPINEPLTTARFSTLYGIWYPNLRDDRAFGRALIHQVQGWLAAVERISAIIPNARFVLTEDLQRFTASDSGVQAYGTFLRERVFLSVELIAGRVDTNHPLFGFLTKRCDVTHEELANIRARGRAPDLVAFNHYPHSERYLFTALDGSPGDVPAVYVEGERPVSAGPLLRAAATRLALPLALGEIHIRAPEDERVRWLAQHIADIEALRREGVDVRAAGAWAAFGMVDWHSLLRARADVTEDGVFTFAGPHGTPQPTAVAHAVAALARGEGIVERARSGWWERPERLRTPDQLLGMYDRGIPEGDHVA
jgi:dTDP-4-dehydrorhamnose reductase